METPRRQVHSSEEDATSDEEEPQLRPAAAVEGGEATEADGAGDDMASQLQQLEHENRQLRDELDGHEPPPGEQAERTRSHSSKGGKGGKGGKKRRKGGKKQGSGRQHGRSREQSRVVARQRWANVREEHAATDQRWNVMARELERHGLVPSLKAKRVIARSRNVDRIGYGFGGWQCPLAVMIRVISISWDLAVLIDAFDGQLHCENEGKNCTRVAFEALLERETTSLHPAHNKFVPIGDAAATTVRRAHIEKTCDDDCDDDHQ